MLTRAPPSQFPKREHVPKAYLDFILKCSSNPPPHIEGAGLGPEGPWALWLQDQCGNSEQQCGLLKATNAETRSYSEVSETA